MQTHIRDFVLLKNHLTRQVVEGLYSAGSQGAVIAEAPPGAGKSTLTVSVASKLIDDDPDLILAIVTQTNEQADDLVRALCKVRPHHEVARMCGGTGPSFEMAHLKTKGLMIGRRVSEFDRVRVIVSTARKWQFERARLQKDQEVSPCRIALIDEAYQMRSDLLLGISSLFQTLFCVGDPGQLDPFSTVDDSLWRGLPYSPSRAALGTLRALHPEIEPIQLPLSWRLPPSAASVVADAFYPNTPFESGTVLGQRSFDLGSTASLSGDRSLSFDAVERAAAEGWGYIELPEVYTSRADHEIAQVIAKQVGGLLRRGATVVDELNTGGAKLDASRVAVIAAHNDQVHAARYYLDQEGIDPNALVVSTANKIQGREYDFVFVWHPLAGRRDASAFHLESGRMCVMLSRHRHGCVVIGRGGALDLIEDLPDETPTYINEPEPTDGWEANYKVLKHLMACRP